MMHHPNNNKRIVTTPQITATLFILATFIVATPATIIGINQSAEVILDTIALRSSELNATAPVVVSGDNIYIAWWTNNTENNNEEVMFRASNDAGQTFSDKINLSNTTDADSWRVEIAGE
jgi:hypothetical protein